MAGPQSVSSVDADAETFLPLISHWKHSMLGEVTAVYRPGEVEIKRVGSTQPTTTPIEGTVMDNEEAMHAMRRLPLQVGYKKYGDVGLEVSDWLPNLATCADDLAVVRSMWCVESNHFTAVPPFPLAPDHGG